MVQFDASAVLGAAMEEVLRTKMTDLLDLHLTQAAEILRPHRQVINAAPDPAEMAIRLLLAARSSQDASPATDELAAVR